MPEQLTLNALRTRVDSGMQTLLNDALSSQKDALTLAMAYTFTPKSKLLRPMLLAATAIDLGSDDWDLIVHAATAIECIHVYSLIHDDLPAMDDDDLRRGQPSCHLAFDEATAILAGDALLTLAFDLLATPKLGQADKQCQLIHALTQASGHQGMALGQVMDLTHMEANTPLKTLEWIYRLKTGKLIESAVQMGAIIAQPLDQALPESLQACGHSLGLAFQIQDDILDIALSEAESGKPQHSDKHRTKPTYPSILGISEAKTQVKALKQYCLDQIKKLPFNISLIKSLIISIIRDF